jgi:hypothetical protein
MGAFICQALFNMSDSLIVDWNLGDGDIEWGHVGILNGILNGVMWNY